MPDIFEPAESATLMRASRAALTRLHPLLRERGASGRVRRAHGDLHLGNIVRIGGRPVLFDAIEFDPLIATGDVLYDLAFLLMDLIERDLPVAANIVFNRYLAETRRDDDLDALTALPFFMSLRAAIRAKVTAARLERADGGKKQHVRKTARTYFRLAQRLIAPPPPLLVAVGGLSGTGKSLLAAALAPDFAPTPGAVVLRSDVERKNLFGKAETDTLPREAYAAEVTGKIYARLAGKARRIAAAGHSALADAVFSTAAERAAIEMIAKEAGVRFIGLFLTADLATRVARVGGRTMDASDADVEVAQRQESYDLGAMDWEMVDASGTPGDTLAGARRALRQNP